MKSFVTALFILTSIVAFTQTGKISGRVFNTSNNESLPFSKVIVVDQQKGAVCLDECSHCIYQA
jgi:hypothetical protein